MASVSPIETFLQVTTALDTFTWSLFQQDLTIRELCYTFVALKLWVAVSLQEQGYYTYLIEQNSHKVFLPLEWREDSLKQF